MGHISQRAELTSELRMAKRRAEVAELYLDGWTQVKIAEHCGIGLTTVHRDLKAIHAEWQRQQAAHFDVLKARELTRIDRVEREAWEAWKQSKQRTVTRTQSKLRESEAEKLREVSTTEHTELGEPRFLDIILDCIAKRVKILGLDAPTRVQLETSGEGDEDFASIDEATTFLTDAISAVDDRLAGPPGAGGTGADAVGD